MDIQKQKGKKAVAIKQDKYGIEVMTMRNGYQWSGFPADIELLEMLRDVLNEFLTSNAEITGRASGPG